MVRPTLLLLFLSPVFLCQVNSSTATIKPETNRNVGRLLGDGTKNSYGQSVHHFLKDFKNMAGGFMANRMDRLKHKGQLMKEKAKNLFRKLVSPFKSTN